MELTRYNCYVGTSRGFLLSTTEKPKELKHIKPEFASEVTALTFDYKQNNIFVGFQNGSVQIYDPFENKYIETVPDLAGKGSIVGLGISGKALIAGKSDGIVNIWKRKKNRHFSLNLDEKATLNSLAVNLNRNSLGTGGEYNDFKLWDIETQQCIFKAKSLGHDNLNLPIPTSVRGITFLPEDPHLSCCCTKEGHVLLYDDRVQRRPVVKFLEPKASYTTITCAYRERQCLVGTTRGYMQLLDMSKGKCINTFTSYTGSVSSIVCDPIEPYVFSTSLDRHLRVHNLNTKTLLHKVYMKVNLTSLLIKAIIKEEQETKKEEDITTENANVENVEIVDEEYESMFDKMEVVKDKLKKKNKGKRSLELLNPIVAMKKLRKLSSNGSDENIQVKSKIKLKKIKYKQED